MDYLQAVSTVGFPITMCFLFFWYINKRDEKDDKRLEALTGAIINQDKHHVESMNKIDKTLLILNENIKNN